MSGTDSHTTDLLAWKTHYKTNDILQEESTGRFFLFTLESHSDFKSEKLICRSNVCKQICLLLKRN